MNHMEIARTIISQIRKTELMAIGAKGFTALSRNDLRLGGLMFQASLFGRGKCKVIIELNGRDLYNVTIVTGRAFDKTVSASNDVFCEDLEGFVVAPLEKHWAA